MRLRTLTATLAGVALALTAGCGSSADVTSDDGGSAKTTSSSTESGDSGDGGGSSDGGEGGDGTTALTAANFASTLTDKQLAAKSVHMTMKGDAAGQSVAIEADMALDADPSKVAAKMTMSAAGQEIQMIMTDGVVYTQMPGAGTDGKWMKLDLGDESMSALLGGMETFDPSSQLKMMEDAITSLDDTGETETIDGVEARRYDLVIDTSNLVGGLPGAAQPGAAGSGLPAEITYQYWVGEDGLPRKVTIDLAQMPMEMLFSQWGEDVSVEAPPAADVVDGSSMLENLPDVSGS